MSLIILGQQQAEKKVNKLNGLEEVSKFILWFLNREVRAESTTRS